MKFSQLAVRLAVTPFGAALDRWCVRFSGESPVSWVFARSEGVDYNPPILLTTHGLLHLLGFDHAEPAEEREMFALQRDLIVRFHAAERRRLKP